jgi:CBS domain-containing protein
MADKNIGAIVIKDQDKLIGIFSERDYARKVVLKGKNSTDTKLSEVMSKEVIAISSENMNL